MQSSRGMKCVRSAALPLALIAATTGCSVPSTREATSPIPVAIAERDSTLTTEPKDATAATRLVNDTARGLLPGEDEDFVDARRGWMAQPSGHVRTKEGRIVWSFEPYAFERAAEAPATVHPNLWRQARLNNMQGMFKVVEGVYQMRGFDISNMTIIEGRSGIIVVDPLHSTETARAAIDLYHQHRPKRPVVAVIHTHADADSFGGVLGVVSEEDVKAKRVKVVAPDGFLEHAVTENVFAATAMSRRAQFVYGARLPVSPRGVVGGRRGKGPSTGTVSLVAPTDVIKKRIEKREIDGVEVEFQLTPSSDEPAEMNLFLPRSRVFCASASATRAIPKTAAPQSTTLRDARNWAQYLNDAIDMYGGKSVALIGHRQHPTFGQTRVAGFLGRQRDMYKHLHDQTLRSANGGALPTAEESPADLDPLAPTDAAKKLVEYMGGPDAVIEKAKKDFAAGNYRWVAQIAKDIFVADPANHDAKALLADSFEQLGYQTDIGTWRTAYLSSAQQLRGVASGPPSLVGTTSSAGMMNALTIPMTFDHMGIRLDAQKAVGKSLAIQFTFGDLGDRYLLTLSNGALNYTKISDRHPGALHPTPEASLTLTKAAWERLSSTASARSLDELIASKKITTAGDVGKVKELFEMLDTARGPSNNRGSAGTDQSTPTSFSTSSARSTVK